MKRDMDLIRLILLDVEGETDVDLSSYSEEEIGYHNWLLIDAGFVEGLDVKGYGDRYNNAIITSLNWEGHDFLDAARDSGIWNKAKENLGAQFATVSIEVIKAVLIAVTKDQLGLTHP